MPILLGDIFNKIPEVLLKRTDENPLPKTAALSREHQDIIAALDAELSDYLHELQLYLKNPGDLNELSQLLTLTVSANEYDHLEQVVKKLYEADWIGNGKKASSLHQLYVAFLNKKNYPAALLHEKSQAEAKITAYELKLKESFTNKVAKEYKKEMAEIDELIRATNSIQAQEVAGFINIFQPIPNELLLLLDQQPIPKLNELTEPQQTIIKHTIKLIGAELINLTRAIASHLHFEEGANPDQILIATAEVLRSQQFDSLQTIVNKFINSDWFGIGEDAFSLVNLHNALTLREAINEGKQLSLQDTKQDLEQHGIEKLSAKLKNAFYSGIETNSEIEKSKQRIVSIEHLFQAAELIKKITEQPSITKQTPGYKILLRFEEKLQKKVVDLDKEEKNKNQSDNDYEQYNKNKQDKRFVLSAMLRQIHLFKTHALSFEELLASIESFQAEAKKFEHTSKLKSFLNERFENLFTVDTKQLLDDFYKELSKSGFQKNNS